MTQRDNIIQELNELQSSLVNIAGQNIYQVPVGYFDELAEQMLRRVKALEAKDAVEELNHLSPLLSSVSKVMPYTVPAGYFETLTEKTNEVVLADDQTPAEELESLSPLLSSLKKEMPYSVPAGYFENFNAGIKNERDEPGVKVISITRQKWFRYAAAAVVIGFVAMAGFLMMNKRENTSTTESGKIVKSLIKSVAPEEIDSFVQMVDAGAPVIASNDPKEINEVKDLIKDVSEKELQDFLDDAQTSVAEDNSDDMFVN